MNEKDYIALNDLLTRYRVEVLRMLGRMHDTSTPASKTLVRQLRNIDFLRNNMILSIDYSEEGIIYAKEPKEIQEEKVSE